MQAERRRFTIISKAHETPAYRSMLNRPSLQDNTNAMDSLILGKDTFRGSKSLKEKTFTVDRQNHILLELFKSKQDKKAKEETKKFDMIRAKLSRGNLRATISRRYNGAVAERVVSKFPEF